MTSMSGLCHVNICNKNLQSNRKSSICQQISGHMVNMRVEVWLKVRCLWGGSHSLPMTVPSSSRHTHTHTHTHTYGLYLLWCEALKPLKLCGGSETMLNLKCDELWPLWLTMDAVQNNLNNRLYSHWRRIKGLQSELCIWSFTNTDMYIVHKYLFIYDFNVNVYVFL